MTITHSQRIAIRRMVIDALLDKTLTSYKIKMKIYLSLDIKMAWDRLQEEIELLYILPLSAVLMAI